MHTDKPLELVFGQGRVHFCLAGSERSVGVELRFARCDQAPVGAVVSVPEAFDVVLRFETVEGMDALLRLMAEGRGQLKARVDAARRLR